MTKKAKEDALTPERERELEERAKEREEALAPFADNLSYDRDRVVNELRFCMNQAAQGIVEAGKRLILLKINEGHGGFLKACEEIGVTRSTAGRFMRAADKVSKLPTLGNLGKSKLYALLDVPDDELKEFEETGQLFGADREEIDSWGVRELKDHIRKQKKQIEKGKKQLEDKETENAELKRMLSPAITEDDMLKRLTEAHLEFEKALVLASTVHVAVSSEYIVREKVTLFTHMMHVAEDAMNKVLEARPDVDLDAIDMEGLPTGGWPERIPGSAEKIADAVTKQQSKRSGRA